MINAIQEALVPAGQTCGTTAPTVSAMSRLHGSVGTTGREPSMEFQMRNKTFISSMVGIAAAVAVAGSANAAVTAFTPTGGLVTNADIVNGNDLMVFTVGASDITVSALGSFNGYVGTRAVGIFAWNNATNVATGSALVSGNVTTDDSRIGFSYAAVDPLVPTSTLTAGQKYVLVGQTVAGNYEYATNISNAGVGSGISFNSYWYNNGGPLNATFTNGTDSTPYFGPNFQFSVVPAPGAVALLGAAGLIAARRRRA